MSVRATKTINNKGAVKKDKKTEVVHVFLCRASTYS